jgi:hypothetical protein
MSVHRIFVLILGLCLCTTGQGHAQAGSELTSFPLLQFSPSARSASLGGAFASVADGDVMGLFHNPALIGPATSRSVGLSYQNHLSDINAGTLAYSHTIRGLGTTVGGGLRFVHWGTLEGRNAFGEPTGSFNAGDVALSLSAARAVGPRWRYGGTVHVVHSGIETARATALAGDVGVLYRWPAQQLSVGASLRNAGTVLDGFGPDDDETLPLDLRLSVSKQLAHLPLRITVSGYDLTTIDEGLPGGSTTDDVLAHIVVGGEVQIGSAFLARVGYNHRQSQQLSFDNRLDLAGLSGGFGVVVGQLTVDYAYSSWSDLGGLHQFTLRADV